MGEVTKLSAFILNRNVTSLVLFLIPGLLFMGGARHRALEAGRPRGLALFARFGNPSWNRKSLNLL